MIITISREYGSGGAEIAHRVADILDIPCYDKSVAALTAASSEFSKESVEAAEDKVSGVFEYLGSSYSVETLPLYDRIYLAQRKAIAELAERGNCVLVGRCAAPILAEQGVSSFNVFVYAPKQQRIERIAARLGLDEKESERRIKIKDNFRKNYYKRYASAEWGARENYHLMINSAMGIEKAAKTIASAARNWKKIL